MQAREYQATGNTQLQRWVDSMLQAVTTRTGRELAEAALHVDPAAWYGFAARFGTPQQASRPTNTSVDQHEQKRVE